MPPNIQEQELINYCHSRSLSCHKVALVSSDGTQMVTIPVEITGFVLPSTVYADRTILASSSVNSVVGSGSLSQGVIIKAISSNLSSCFVGNSAVGPTNYQFSLDAGESTAVAVGNLSCVYVAVIANNDGVQYIGS